MNWLPFIALNWSASWKLMPKKRPAIAVPEGRSAALVDDAAQFGQHAVAEAGAVLLDEQVAAAGEQHARPAGALAGVEEQAADFADEPSRSVTSLSISARKVRSSSLRGLGEAC